MSVVRTRGRKSSSRTTLKRARSENSGDTRKPGGERGTGTSRPWRTMKRWRATGLTTMRSRARPRSLMSFVTLGRFLKRIGAGFRKPAILCVGNHDPADLRRALEHRHPVAVAVQPPRRGEAGEAAADDGQRIWLKNCPRNLRNNTKTANGESAVPDDGGIPSCHPVLFAGYCGQRVTVSTSACMHSSFAVGMIP